MEIFLEKADLDNLDSASDINSFNLLQPLTVVTLRRTLEAQFFFLSHFWMILGILIGVLIGKDLPEREFKWAMVVVIFISLGMLVFWDRRKSKKVPTHWLFSGSMGIFSGICTMIGNLAGAFTNIFFLAMRLPKNEFVGTAAWLFFITNMFKMPFHVFVWKTITVDSLLINLRLLPAIFVGLLLGVFLVKRINEKN